MPRKKPVERPDLPDGPLNDLMGALHDLYDSAGWPSFRDIARGTGYSHPVAGDVLKSQTLPTRPLLLKVVHSLAVLARKHEEDCDPAVERVKFGVLHSAASKARPKPGDAPIPEALQSWANTVTAFSRSSTLSDTRGTFSFAGADGTYPAPQKGRFTPTPLHLDINPDSFAEMLPPPLMNRHDGDQRYLALIEQLRLIVVKHGETPRELTERFIQRQNLSEAEGATWRDELLTALIDPGMMPSIELIDQVLHLVDASEEDDREIRHIYTGFDWDDD